MPEHLTSKLFCEKLSFIIDNRNQYVNNIRIKTLASEGYAMVSGGAITLTDILPL